MNALFDVSRPDKASDNSIAKRSKSKEKKSVTTVKGGDTLLTRINQIKAVVEQSLGKYKDETEIITNIDILHDYMNYAVIKGVIAIDTETTGLDPLQNDIVGLCIYVPGSKPAYVPITHRSYITGLIYDEQLIKDDVKDELHYLLAAKPKIIMANAKFDIRFIRNQLHVENIYATWDCLIASKLMNENEVHNNLKYLYNKYCLDGKEDIFRFDDLFKGISFDLVPYKSGAVYAAHDALMTYELYEYQKKYLYYVKEEDLSSRNGMNGVAWVYENIEIPCISVVADMEDTGVAFDFDVHKKLEEVYHKKLDEALQNFYTELDKYKELIDEYKLQNPNNKLSDPINVSSPTQLAILLYDILKAPSVDKKYPRGTGVDILKKLDDIPICKIILEYRTVEKLVSTYIDKLPECVNPNDGRIHCSFNQYGAVTGRFSSENPNLQNIPSHNKDIRQMFKATDGYVLMSSDYSQQENSEFVKVEKWCEVDTPDGFKYADKMRVGDKLKMSEDGVDVIVEITKIINPVGNNHLVYYYK